MRPQAAAARKADPPPLARRHAHARVISTDEPGSADLLQVADPPRVAIPVGEFGPNWAPKSLVKRGRTGYLANRGGQCPRYAFSPDQFNSQEFHGGSPCHHVCGLAPGGGGAHLRGAALSSHQPR